MFRILPVSDQKAFRKRTHLFQGWGKMGKSKPPVKKRKVPEFPFKIVKS